MEILEEEGHGGGGLGLLQTSLAPGAQQAPVSLFCLQGGAVEGGRLLFSSVGKQEWHLLFREWACPGESED